MCGSLAFLLCGLFPPWLQTYDEGNVLAHTIALAEKSAGFSFIFIAPSGGNRVDTARLGVEWLCVLAATGAAWVLLANPRRDETRG